MLTPQEEVTLGRGAAELLKADSVFTRALAQLESKYREDARQTPPGALGRDLREALHAKNCALDDIRIEIKIMQDTGELAARQIAEEEKRAKK